MQSTTHEEQARRTGTRNRREEQARGAGTRNRREEQAPVPPCSDTDDGEQEELEELECQAQALQRQERMAQLKFEIRQR